MNYKKKYDAALEAARKFKEGSPHLWETEANPFRGVFKELKETEDEKVRKALSECVEDYRCKGVKEFFDVPIENVLSWLEKQGEQNLDDKVEPKFKPGDKIVEKDIDECGSGTIKEIRDGKYIFEDNCFIYIKEQDLWQLVKEPVEPKFKVGDWIVYEGLGTYKVVEIHEGWYSVIDGNDRRWSVMFENESLCHLWTIQDAKDGDVLNSMRVQATITFKGFADDGKHILAYCALQKGIFIKQEMLWDRDFEPCPKNWNDELFSKMKEAGYEWDAEKKELKKIEQKPAWNEEDERICRCLIKGQERALDDVRNDKYGHSEIISDLKEMYRERIDWLKSLKDRVQPQPKQEWSEEDEKMLLKLEKHFDWNDSEYRFTKDDCDKALDWLKSIKHHIGSQVKNRWKQ